MSFFDQQDVKKGKNDFLLQNNNVRSEAVEVKKTINEFTSTVGELLNLAAEHLGLTTGFNIRG